MERLSQASLLVLSWTFVTGYRIGRESRLQEPACEEGENTTFENILNTEEAERFKSYFFSRDEGSANRLGTDEYSKAKAQTQHGVELKALYRVNQGQQLVNYHEKARAADVQSNSTYPVSTARQSIVDKLRSSLERPRLIHRNERLLLHGLRNKGSAKSKDVAINISCQGFTKGKKKPGAFGDGVYLTDEIEKVDQYSGHAENTVDDADNFRWFLVVRAYLGKPVQVQREDDPPKKIYHWRDPWGDQRDENIIEIKRNYSDFNGRAPPRLYKYDSVEVMCTRVDPNYSREWQKLDSSGRSNTMPYRFKEYVVPFSNERYKNQLTVEYMVGYVTAKQETKGKENLVEVSSMINKAHNASGTKSYGQAIECGRTSFLLVFYVFAITAKLQARPNNH